MGLHIAMYIWANSGYNWNKKQIPESRIDDHPKKEYIYIYRCTMMHLLQASSFQFLRIDRGIPRANLIPPKKMSWTLIRQSNIYPLVKKPWQMKNRTSNGRDIRVVHYIHLQWNTSKVEPKTLEVLCQHFLVRLVSEFHHSFSRVKIIFQKEPPFLKWWLTSREKARISES